MKYNRNLYSRIVEREEYPHVFPVVSRKAFKESYIVTEWLVYYAAKILHDNMQPFFIESRGHKRRRHNQGGRLRPTAFSAGWQCLVFLNISVYVY